MSKPLDGRLAAAAALVRSGSVMADIGTDHGYLICHAVASGRSVRGYACDINAQPLERARRTIEGAGLAGTVETVLTSGLRGLEGKGITDIAILGMGGDLIGDILRESAMAKDPALHFILQPMTKADHLRRELYRMGFRMERETAVFSGRFVYSVFSVFYTGKEREADDLFAWTGKVQAGSGDAARAYLEQAAARVQKKAEGLKASGKYSHEAERYALLADKIRCKAKEGRP